MKHLSYSQIKEITKVLEFYANDRNHDEKYRNLWNSEYYQSEVMLDAGERAREVLKLLNKKTQ